MGATKRVAEMVVQAKAAEHAGTSKVCMVRFGNVIGSSGSVIPKFSEQIESGGPVTVTHPDIVRYFMSIPEAAQLVIQASALCEGGIYSCSIWGKTWLTCALGNQMCRQGRTVRYVRLSKLFEQLRMAHGDDSYSRLMNQLFRVELLIIDDWGPQAMTAPQRNDLIEIIEDRHARRSTLITSQLPIEHWHDYIGEATVADAILDRLLNGVHRLQLIGDSMRRSIKSSTQEKTEKS